MGTSSSSKGPGAGVALVPGWVDPAPASANAPPPAPPAVAPPRRFQSARRNLGGFAASGDAGRLRQGLGHYVRTGLGGSASATSRMAGTSRTAGRLYDTLNSLSGGGAPPAEVSLDPASLAGLSQGEIADRLADAIRPVDGAQDSEAARDALSRSLSELLSEQPDVDLTNLDAAQMESVVESYVGHDLAHRIELDVGAAVFSRAPSIPEGVERMQEMQDYVRQAVAAAFRARRERGERMTAGTAGRLTATVLRDTLEVFESYL
ncbi:MAG: hypothetical protein DI534_15015 [Leifsonia xyli]|nr:MAG: hypothetical protein DI534_15015 [Leifsonia xyli]